MPEPAPGPDPADFYTGLVADLYAPLRGSRTDPEPYATFVAGAGSPALELGCGDGDPLIELRRRGLDVEGVDSSADMLERCRRRAAAVGVEVTLHHQRMESLDLPRRFRSVFLAGPTFTLLPDDDLALRALRGIHDHLDVGGTALVPLWVPDPTPHADLGRARETTAADGARLRFTIRAEERDEATRTRRSQVRYERETAGGTTVVDREWLLHWHTPASFRALATAAGLDLAGPPPPDDATYFTVRLHRPT